MATAFANAFDPPLAVVQTARIDGAPHSDAWACSYWNPDRSAGVTAVVFSGQIKAYLELIGRAEDAKEFGNILALALGCASSDEDAH